MFERLTYKKINSMTCTVDYYGRTKTRDPYFSTNRYYGKDAYVSDCYDDDNPIPKIKEAANRFFNYGIPGNSKIFISKSSNFPRALLRNTGYSITINKEKADYIVIPDIYKDEKIKSKYNLIAVHDDILWLIRVSIDENLNKDDETIIKDVLAAVSNHIHDYENKARFYFRNRFSSSVVYFLKKCDEYIDILNTEPCLQGKYCFDDKLDFDPITTVTPESLEILYRCNDKTIFEKSIVGTEWNKYPLTFCLMFYLKSVRRSYNICSGSPAIQLIRKTISYDDFDSDGYGSAKTISKEDWNMSQQWMMLRLGLDPENGGFMSNDNNDYSLIYNYLRHAIAIKPKFIDKDVDISYNLESILY